MVVCNQNALRYRRSVVVSDSDSNGQSNLDNVTILAVTTSKIFCNSKQRNPI